MLRIIAGGWRGRRLAAPAGGMTRPTADRLRQALFDMLMHAAWFGPALLEEALVLDVFAGSGALGLEALSRGAPEAVFIERDRAALAALRANIAACGAARTTVLAADALRPPAGRQVRLAFLDPPYAADLLPGAVAALTAAGWLGPGTVLVAESAADAPAPELPGETLAERQHGAARLTIRRL